MPPQGRGITRPVPYVALCGAGTLPTSVLPYLGRTMALLHGSARAAEGRDAPTRAPVVHLSRCLALCASAAVNGGVVRRRWRVVLRASGLACNRTAGLRVIPLASMTSDRLGGAARRLAGTQA